VLIDADSRLLVTLVIGRQETETARQAFADFYRRTEGDLTPLITSDEYAPYLTVVVQTYGVAKEDLELTQEQKDQYDYPSMPEVYFPVEMAYATVHKEREGAMSWGWSSVWCWGPSNRWRRRWPKVRRPRQSTPATWSGITGRSDTSTPARPGRFIRSPRNWCCMWR
jgi:hypothetical protein